MPRTKKKKLEDINNLENIIRIFGSGKETEDRIIKYLNPSEYTWLEIGCGHGEHTYHLSRENTLINYIGIDIKSTRFYNLAKSLLEENSRNALFLQGNAENLIKIFHTIKFDTIVIPFPEPNLRRSWENKRLTSPYFINIYRNILKKSGKIYFKTDSDFLFNYTLNVLDKENCKIHFSYENIHGITFINEISHISTTYERYYIKDKRIIKFISFGF